MIMTLIKFYETLLTLEKIHNRERKEKSLPFRAAEEKLTKVFWAQTSVLLTALISWKTGRFV